MPQPQSGSELDNNMTPDIATIVNLGIGGLAIYILYLQSKSANETQKVMIARLKEKDAELITEIDKRDTRNDQKDKDFKGFVDGVIKETNNRISENTKALAQNATALNDNIKVMKSVKEHLSQPHSPIVIQNNTGEAAKQ